MKHDFIDKYSNLNSPIHKIDARIKIISALFAIIIISSESLSGKFLNIILYFALSLLLVILSKIPVKFLLKRMLIVLPFILMAAIFYPLSLIISSSDAIENSWWFYSEAGLSMFIKATTALLILVLLSSSDKFQNILIALRKLMMPEVVVTTSALLYRYIFLLEDELLRTSRARSSRTFGSVKKNSLKVYGNQAAMIFLRSWDRSQIIYKSMLSRGFNGKFHDISVMKLKVADIVASVIFVALLLIIKFMI